MYNDVFSRKKQKTGKRWPSWNQNSRGRDIGIYLFLWLDCIVVWQTPTQHCKQLSSNKNKFKESLISTDILADNKVSNRQITCQVNKNRMYQELLHWIAIKLKGKPKGSTGSYLGHMRSSFPRDRSQAPGRWERRVLATGPPGKYPVYFF